MPGIRPRIQGCLRAVSTERNYSRATTRTALCGVRAGANKHSDLGRGSRASTRMLPEMLSNFEASAEEIRFKPDAIKYAWELLTR